jgi:acyl-CoA thioester hydrolase
VESQADRPAIVGGEYERPYSGAFVGKTHRFALRVYFEDTDVAQVVYYANYLKFMERARSDMLRLAGIDQWAVIQRGEGAYAVADLSIKYRMPARLDDELLVVSSIRQVRGASVLIHQRVMRRDELLTDALVTAAFLSKQGRPQRQPREWVEIFKRLEGEQEE